MATKLFVRPRPIILRDPVDTVVDLTIEVFVDALLVVVTGVDDDEEVDLEA